MKTRLITILKSQFFKFSYVGAIGFAIDAGIVWFLTTNHIHPIIAQVIAFLLAVICTFFLNRRFSFPNTEKKWFQQLLNYILGTSVGSFVNNTVYIVLVLESKLFYSKPVFAVAIGSLLGMVFNFVISKFWVFR